MVSDSTAVLVRRPGPRPRTVTVSSGEQAAKAALLLADGGLVPHPHPGVWFVVSSDGERLYLTSPHGCTCPAGMFGVRCYHSVAAAILASGPGRNLSRRMYRESARRGRGNEQASAAREIARAARRTEAA